MYHHQLLEQNVLQFWCYEYFFLTIRHPSQMLFATVEFRQSEPLRLVSFYAHGSKLPPRFNLQLFDLAASLQRDCGQPSDEASCPQ